MKNNSRNDLKKGKPETGNNSDGKRNSIMR
jgi:hypothetical protein